MPHPRNAPIHILRTSRPKQTTSRSTHTQTAADCHVENPASSEDVQLEGIDAAANEQATSSPNEEANHTPTDGQGEASEAHHEHKHVVATIAVEDEPAKEDVVEAVDEFDPNFSPPPLTPKTPPKGSPPKGFHHEHKTPHDHKISLSPLTSGSKSPLESHNDDGSPALARVESPKNASIDTSPGTTSVRGAASMFQKNITNHLEKQMSLDEMKKRNKEDAERKKREAKEAEERAIREKQEAEERAIREKQEAEERAIREKQEAEERAIRERQEAEERARREQEAEEERRRSPAPASPVTDTSMTPPAKDELHGGRELHGDYQGVSHDKQDHEGEEVEAPKKVGGGCCIIA